MESKKLFEKINAAHADGPDSKEQALLKNIRRQQFHQTRKAENMRVFSAKSFGRIVRNRRKELGLTQTELAEQTVMNQTTISLIETGNSATKLITIIRLMSVLDLDMDISPRVKIELKDDEW